MSIKRKGDGAAGGGLQARIKAWEALPGDNVTPTVKLVNRHDPGNRLYHKPGSQNRRKGGRGRLP